MTLAQQLKNKYVNGTEVIEYEYEPKPSEFPLDVFPENLQWYINSLNDALNFSKDFLSIGVIFSIATAVGNKFKLQIKTGWEAPLIFWFMAVGAPGTMKTHPLSMVLSPLKNKDSHNYENYVRALKDWRQNKENGPKPTFNQTIVQDSTLEAIHDVHKFNPKGIGYYRDELVGFLNDMNKYRGKGSDEQFWLESFNNGQYTINRVTKDTNLLKNIFINIIGTIQPNVLEQVVSKQEGNGLIDRFLFTKAETNIYPITDLEISKGTLEWWDKMVVNLIKDTPYYDKDDTIMVHITEEAFQSFLAVDQRHCAAQMDDEKPETIKNYISKIKTYLPRFCLFFAILDNMFNNNTLIVTPDHVAKADKVCNYFIETSWSVFIDSNKLTEINEVVSLLKGKSTADKIRALHARGFKQVDIAKKLKTYKSYVSKVLAS